MSRAVRFDYFKVYLKRLDETTNTYITELCDLHDMLQDLEESDIELRSFEVNGEGARIQAIDYIDDLWRMHLLRIRKGNFPLRARDNGEINYFDDFGEDEGFGEEASALYDGETGVIMIRRNMHSLAPSALSTYLTSLIAEPGAVITFAPLVHPASRTLLRNDNLIRGAEVTIADVKNASERTKRSLGQFLRGIDDIEESVTVSFKIGLAQRGSRKDSELPIHEQLATFADEPNAVSVSVRQKADEDARVEYIDLINNRLYEYHSFSHTDINTQSRNILHKTVIDRMLHLYRDRKAEIIELYE